MERRIWRGGMVGAGAWSATQLQAWSRVEGARIVALADRHPERRDPIGREFGISALFDSLAAMLEGVELDFVDICTRPYSHAPLVRQAADRGLPVLCQKPFCTTLSEARAVVEACATGGVRLMVNENFRWQPWHRLVRQILVEGLLGRPFLTTMRQRSRLTLPEFKHYQRYFAEMPHLLLTEVGVHLLDVHRFLFGEPETVYARLHRLSPHVRGEDVQVLILGYPGMTSLIVDSWASVPIPGRDRPDVSRKWFPRVLEIDGTEGTLILQPDGSVRLFTDADQRTWDAPEDGMQQAHSAALQHFIDCLESGAEFETSGRETLKTLELMYVGYQSADQGRPVSPAELLALL